MGAPVERVTDVEDPRLADYRELRETDHRRRGLFVAEGRLAVRQLLQSGRFGTRSLLTTEPMLNGLRDLLEAAPATPAVLLASPELIRQAVGFKFHRGCLAVGERGPGDTPVSLIDVAGSRLMVVLEGLVDPANVGAVFRNALAFGAAAVLLSPGCGDPLARKAIRASGGATLRLPFAPADPWLASLRLLGQAGYEIIALTPDGVESLDAIGTPLGRVALLLGNEGRGLSPDARASASRTVRIAMASGVDSLNVATASGIALYYLRAIPSIHH